MENISIEIAHHLLHPEVATLRIKGFLYANTLPEFDKTLRSVLDSSKKKLIFDLSETTYISSGGWSMFLVSFQRVKELGGDILLVGMKPEVRDAFELLEYDKILRCFPSAETALKEGFTRVLNNPAGAPVTP
jgi:anti-anti-sigma factor